MGIQKRNNSFKLSKMFRWLKDRKKRPENKVKVAEDDYGFKKKHGDTPTQNDYGFYKCKNKNINRPRAKTPLNDSSFHIYEEILDLPELPGDQNESFIDRTNGSTQLSNSNVNFHLLTSSHVKREEPEGPYMVVPIVCRSEDNTAKCPICRSDIISDQLPCVCRRKFRPEVGYTEPWDSSESTCSVADFVESQNTRTKHMRNRRCERVDSYTTSNSSECSCSSGKSSITSRSGPDGSDTCCEYDMSTSSESDVTDNVDYRSYLDKVQQNLLLKEQVRNIIRSLSNSGDNLTSEDSSNTLERSDNESMIATSSGSGRSSRHTLSGCEVSDPDLPADRSESDYSSGYCESAEDRNEASGNSDNAQEHILRISTSDKDTRQRAYHHRKSKSHRIKRNKSLTEENGNSSKCAIAEDTEMYLLPANKRDSDCDNIRVFRKPLLPPQQTLIYQDPHRSKTGSSNRLLCDLIRMNYDKQHMIHV